MVSIRSGSAHTEQLRSGAGCTEWSHGWYIEKLSVHGVELGEQNGGQHTECMWTCMTDMVVGIQSGNGCTELSHGWCMEWQWVPGIKLDVQSGNGHMELSRGGCTD